MREITNLTGSVKIKFDYNKDDESLSCVNYPMSIPSFFSTLVV